MTQGVLSPKAAQLYNSLGFKSNPAKFVTVTEKIERSFPVAQRESLQLGNTVSWESYSMPHRGRIISRPWHPDGEKSLLAVEVELHAVIIENHWMLNWASSEDEAISLIEQQIRQKVEYHLNMGLKDQVTLKKKVAKLTRELEKLNKSVEAQRLAMED